MNCFSGCLINPKIDGGNITCPASPVARGSFIVTSGNQCHLSCKKDYVSYDAQEATCYNGRLSHDLYCVLPGAMIVVGGRSDTSGTKIFLWAIQWTQLTVYGKETNFEIDKNYLKAFLWKTTLVDRRLYILQFSEVELHHYWIQWKYLYFTFFQTKFSSSINPWCTFKAHSSFYCSYIIRTK